MKKTVLRGMGIALLLGMATGMFSWWLGKEILAAKPLAKSSGGGQDPVLAAFAASGAKFLELNLIGWAQLNKQFLDEKELVAVAWSLAENFGPREGLTARVTKGQNWRQVQLERGEKIRILVQTRAARGKEPPQTYYSLSLSSPDLTGYGRLKAQAEASLKGISDKDKSLSTVLAGWYPGALTAKGMRNVAHKALATSGAAIVEGVGEKNFLSISGYTPQIKHSLRILDHEVNFNVAVRVNPREKKTYFYIGSPLIAREY